MKEVFDDKDIDVVIIGTPEHWHSLATVWVLRQGMMFMLRRIYPFPFGREESRLKLLKSTTVLYNVEPNAEVGIEYTPKYFGKIVLSQ